MSEYSRRWESLQNGYLPPSKLDIDPSVRLHDAAAVDSRRSFARSRALRNTRRSGPQPGLRGDRSRPTFW